MREIKFRIWIANQFHYIDFSGQKTNHLIVNNQNSELAIWQQYTGVKDKNDREIYEGDIVKFLRWPKEKCREIIFLNGTFTYKNTFYDFDGILDSSECEVIGNIFENPELVNNK